MGGEKSLLNSEYGMGSVWLGPNVENVFIILFF